LQNRQFRVKVFPHRCRLTIVANCCCRAFLAKQNNVDDILFTTFVQSAILLGLMTSVIVFTRLPCTNSAETCLIDFLIYLSLISFFAARRGLSLLSRASVIILLTVVSCQSCFISQSARFFSEYRAMVRRDSAYSFIDIKFKPHLLVGSLTKKSHYLLHARAHWQLKPFP